MAAMEAANAHYHNGSQHSGLPASPTLTNPDMILPEFEERSYSPDPDLGGREHHPLMMWKDTHAAATAADMQSLFAAAGSSSGSGLLLRNDAYGPNGPMTPTTPIIYGNGTMLSDIGEVTEAESTPGRPSPSQLRARRAASLTRRTGIDTALRSSPTIGAAALTQKSKPSSSSLRERRESMESTSTITTEERAGLFADFDDSASVGDSVFQGDDEESLASSYVDGNPGPDGGLLGVSKADSVDRLSTYSMTSLSRRAEEILANAKQRLTTMENNLTRARSSLHTNAPVGSDGSTPSPPPQRTGITAANQAGGHTRMSSDIAMRNGLPYRVAVPRSQSALGAAGGYRQPLVGSRSADQIREELDEEHGRPTYNIPQANESGLQPLTEDEVAQLEGPDRDSHAARIEAFLSPTSGSFGSDSSRRNSMQRSTSAAQMRDIKDQMKDLKGKISNLREQARADNLKRRSLQSLRTPSPFTHSQIDHWYAEPPSNRNSVHSTLLPDSGLDGGQWTGEEFGLDGGAEGRVIPQPRGGDGDGAANFVSDVVEEHARLPEDAVTEPETQLRPVSGTENVDAVEDDDDVSDMLTENGDAEGDEFQDADEDYMSESGESLYHDTVQHQISHEDREDAFDYEHFFLHSAMGTMSRQRLVRRRSVESYTSEDSAETTRGPARAETSDSDFEVSPHRSISRRHSNASISTVETFATAEESRSRKSPISPGDVLYSPEGTFGDYPKIPAPNTDRKRSRSASTATARRSPFNTGNTHLSAHGTVTSTNLLGDSDISSIPEEGSEYEGQQLPHNSGLRRPMSMTAFSSTMYRPSVSSFDSQGTNRSFPLVNKPRRVNSNGMLTPGDSPDQDLRSISDTLMSETASICEQERAIGQPTEAPRARAASAASALPTNLGTNTPEPMQALLREDKYLVERLVANLGKCVLGLTENGRASSESRMYRRRIDAARRILEGLEVPPGSSGSIQ
ncbi:hypothetical protein QBC35DRAFT_126729 [Podospora australis]|uniref:Uncharacterized protein n=1 Tax=Podospora australis TaxID=1536484 RepID=A0AAN6WXD5_9PEZI|nr:hypothetical protein QBC35DRAFT_126729 [Podospora australis]